MKISLLDLLLSKNLKHSFVEVLNAKQCLFHVITFEVKDNISAFIIFFSLFLFFCLILSFI